MSSKTTNFKDDINIQERIDNASEKLKTMNFDNSKDIYEILKKDLDIRGKEVYYINDDDVQEERIVVDIELDYNTITKKEEFLLHLINSEGKLKIINMNKCKLKVYPKRGSK